MQVEEVGCDFSHDLLYRGPYPNCLCFDMTLNVTRLLCFCIFFACLFLVAIVFSFGVKKKMGRL